MLSGSMAPESDSMAEMREREDNPIIQVGDKLAPRWIAPLFLLLAVALLPWTAYLFVSLPVRSISHHYNLSWAGFDVLLIVALARTAWLAWHNSRQVELPAVATAVLLVVDAWFDVTTAKPGWPFAQALLMAVFAELPTAALALYISRRARRVADQDKLEST